MVYTYDAANPDRLYRIADLAPSASRPYGFKPKGVPSYYGFDNAGNMTSDGHKDLSVAYNALNLPDVFTFANVTPNNKIEIVYNAAGEKLEKQVYTGATLSTHKRYVMGIEYTGANLEAIYHAEGRIVPIGGGVFRYEYTLKDHLGNSRVMFAANGTAISLLQENHYYPFGMEMKGAWIAQSGTENGYQYNGKELNEDWGLNWSDYGARWYDPSVGRWNSVDPLAEKMKKWSVYTYALNNPMVFIDMDGQIPFPVNATYKGQKFRIESWFGWRNTGLSYASRYHLGLDFNFGGGRFDYGAPVLTTHTGTVSVKNNLKGNEGRTVTVTSPDGKFRTKYLHLKKITVKEGQKITEADQIGEIGGSRVGQEFGGQVHLHYQIEKYNSETNEWEVYNPTEGKEKSAENVVDPQTWIVPEKKEEPESSKIPAEPVRRDNTEVATRLITALENFQLWSPKPKSKPKDQK